MEENNNQFNVPPILKQEGSADAYFNSLPRGYRFFPTDAELVSCYLKGKVWNKKLPTNRIHNVDICEHHPRDLTGVYNLVRESEWYFFTSRKRKYPNGHRPNRSAVHKSAVHGFWKATGKAVSIKDVEGKVIGSKRVLDFLEGTHQENKKTEWKMHEYKLSKDMKLDDCILCKIYEKTKSDKDKNNDDAERTIESDRGAVPATNTVASEAFPYQSIQPLHQQQSPLVGESIGTSSTANKRHCGMSTSTILNTNVGNPTYYDQQYSFQNQTSFGYHHPGSMNNFNNQNYCTQYNMQSANITSAVPSKESFSSSFPLPQSMDQIGIGLQPVSTVNQLPLADPRSIWLPAHVREYECSPKNAVNKLAREGDDYLLDEPEYIL